MNQKQRNQLFKDYPTCDCVGTYTQRNYFRIETNEQAAAMVGQWKPIEVLHWWQVGNDVNVVSIWCP